MTRAVALALAAAVSAAAPLGAQPAADTFHVRGVPVAVEAGSFVVPAERGAAGDTATLRLAYVRFPSTASAPGAPIVFLAGGPGDAATRALAGMPPELLAALRAIADVVAFDQRGTGRSEPRDARCPPGAALPRDRAFDPAAALDLRRGELAACLRAAAARGVRVGGLTTVESADDLEALRRALGAPRLTLLAGSYGTHLALAAARRHPALVARMALLAVEGPDHTLKLPSATDAVLAAIAAARRPSLPAEVDTLRRRLAAGATYAFPTGRTIVLGPWDVQRWVAGALGTRREIDALLAAMPAVLAGDLAPLARAALAERAPRPVSLMHEAMDCASYASPARLAQVRREAPAARLGDAVDFPLPGLCDVPGLPRLDEAFRAPVASPVPALLVAGTFDGRTPPANAAEVARGLPNARVLVLEGASHGLFGEPAATAALLAFLREGR